MRYENQKLEGLTFDLFGASWTRSRKLAALFELISRHTREAGDRDDPERRWRCRQPGRERSLRSQPLGEIRLPGIRLSPRQNIEVGRECLFRVVSTYAPGRVEGFSPMTS